jgi:hypothetical protein
MHRLSEFLQFVACEGGMTTVAGVIVGGIVGSEEPRLLLKQLRQYVYVRPTKVTSSLPLKLDQAVNDQVWLLIEVDAALPFALSRGLSRILLNPKLPSRVLFYVSERVHMEQLQSEVWRSYLGPIFNLSMEDLYEPTHRSSL